MAHEFIGNGKDNKGYRCTFTRHIKRRRVGPRGTSSERLVVSKEVIVELLKSALRETNLIKRLEEVGKVALILPSEDRTYYVGILLALEGRIVVVISMYDVPTDKYKKAGIFPKEEKVYFDDFDLETVVRKDVEKQQRVVDALEKRKEVGMFPKEESQNKTTLRRAPKREIYIPGHKKIRRVEKSDIL